MNDSTLTLIKGGRVIDPVCGLDATSDVLIEGGLIREVGRIDTPNGCRVIDADGLIVAPGLVDMHVHLREPGYEYKETIAGGTRAAAAGGVTSVAAMPNTQPVTDDPSVVGYVLEKARMGGIVNVFPIGAVTKGLQGKELTEIGLLIQAGCVAFSDDGRAISNSSVMRRALDYARAFGALIIQHAEDPSLASEGCMNEGITSTRLGIPGIPAESESILVDRDIRLVELTGGRYHVAHLSTAGALQSVERAIQRHLPVSCEIAPHHFALTEEAVIGYNTDAKMAPPLRSEMDRNALLEGFARGIVAAIATDHAPHDEDSKRVEFCCAANGVVGLETLLPVSLELVRDGVMSLSDCLAVMTYKPSELLGINRGTLQVGRPADVVLFAEQESWIVDAKKLHGSTRNTPFHGRRVQGRVKRTLVAGKAVYEDGQ
ncbi:MAG: dihydroorotase [Magnetococcales bacterium]|nr:dihydroorotase [Magnetococcales bacterium]